MRPMDIPTMIDCYGEHVTHRRRYQHCACGAQIGYNPRRTLCLVCAQSPARTSRSHGLADRIRACCTGRWRTVNEIGEELDEDSCGGTGVASRAVQLLKAGHLERRKRGSVYEYRRVEVAE